MKLYDIDESIKDLEDKLNQAINMETGEITTEFEDIQAELDNFAIKKEKKCLNIAKLIINKQAESKALADEIKKLQARKKQSDSSIEWLKRYVTLSLQKDPLIAGEKLSDNQCQITWRKSQSVNIVDESLIPDEFIKIKREPNKSDIARFLKDGKTVYGCELDINYKIGIK